MISLVLICIFTVVLLFGFVVLFGAPFLPTLSKQADAALDLAKLQPGDHMLELGCGDGRVMIKALERGADVTGYELNPLLALIAWVRTRRYGSRAKVVCGNFWRIKLPKCDVIFVFLLPKYMTKLDKKITQEIRVNVKLVSFAFEIPNKSCIAESNGVFAYEFKAEKKR